MAFFINEDILGLQIAIDNVAFMQILQPQQDLSRVELGDLFGELAIPPKQVK